MRAGIVVVGNELLQGHVRDANGPHLARALTRLGHDVRRLVVVPDEQDVIVQTLEALASGAEDTGPGCELLFTCGGLGPTLDDITVEAVADFLGVDLHSPEEAREQIREIYRKGRRMGFLADDAVDEGAWRMARVPMGATVVANDAGAAPGSVVQGDGVTVFVLPGPPAELQSVWENMVQEDLVPLEDDLAHETEVHLATFEAPIAATLQELCDEHPEVRLGSYPKHGEKRVVVRLRGPRGTVEAAEAWLRDRCRDLVLDMDA